MFRITISSSSNKTKMPNAWVRIQSSTHEFLLQFVHGDSFVSFIKSGLPQRFRNVLFHNGFYYHSYDFYVRHIDKLIAAGPCIAKRLNENNNIYQVLSQCGLCYTEDMGNEWIEDVRRNIPEYQYPGGTLVLCADDTEVFLD